MTSANVMNERIKELMPTVGACQGWQGDDGPMSSGKVVHYYSEDQMLQFAELIVKECADLFDKDEMELSLTEHRVNSMIKEHFGVNGD